MAAQTSLKAAGLRYLAGALGIRADEGRQVAAIIGASFFLGLALVFFYTASNAIFLTSFDISSLPYVYIVNAVLAIVFGVLYAAIEKRASFARRIYIVHVLLAAITLVFWVSLAADGGRLIVFLGMAWFRLLYIFTRLELMAIASVAFDVRQAKRLFSLIGLGLMLAFILGGLLMSSITGLLGTTNLVLLSSLSLLLYAGVLSRTLASLNLQEAARPAATEAPRQPVAELLKDRFIVTILAIKAVAMLIGFVTEYIFYQQAAAYYQDEEVLAGFLGTFMGATMLVMVVITGVLAGRYISRYGVKLTLATMPFLVAVTALAGVLYGALFQLNTLFFALVCGMMAINQISEKAFYGPAVAILYQPLAPRTRMAVVVISEGWFNSASLLASGVLLLALNWLPFQTIVPFVCLLLILAVIFLWLVVVVSRQYTGKLQQSIKARFKTGVALGDQLDPELLLGQLHSSNPGMVLFSFDYLDDEVPASVLPELLAHPSVDVRLEALRRIEKCRYQPALSRVQQLVSSPDAPVRVRGQALITLFSLRGDAAPADELRPYALVGALRYGGQGARDTAREQLRRLAGSPASADRLTVLEILRQVPGSQPDDIVVGLLRDRDPVVRRGAIQAAGRSITPRVRAELLDLLPDRRYRSSIIKTLGQDNDEAVAAIEARFDQLPDEARCSALAVCGAIGSTRALAFLEDRFARAADLPASTYQALLLALRRAGYRTRNVAAITEHIRYEARAAAVLLDYLHKLPGDLLRRNLLSDLGNAKQRMFLLLSFIYDPELIKEIERYIIDGGGENSANAFEMLDIALDGEIKSLMFSVLEAPAPTAPGNAPTDMAPERLRSIIGNDKVFGSWTQSCARYITAQQHQGQSVQEEPMFATVEKVITLRSIGIFSQTPDPILAELAELLGETFVPAGKQIIEKESFGDQMYVVVAGKLRIHDGDRTIAVMGTGEFVGEMAVLAPAPRSADVTAIEDTHLFVLTQDVLFDLMQSRPEVIQSILRALIERLRQVT